MQILRWVLQTWRSRPALILMGTGVLTLGLLSILLIQSFKDSIQLQMSDRSKLILSSDISISGRRAMTTEESKQVNTALPLGTKQLQSISLYTMLRGKTNTRLCDVNAIQPEYPFYGFWVLKQRGKVTAQDISFLFSDYSTIISQDLSLQLELKIGDTILLGRQKIKVADIILETSSDTWRGFSFAPNIFISLETLKKTGLTEFGSLMSHETFYKLPVSTDEAVKKAEALLHKTLQDNSLRIQTHLSASEQVTTTLRYLNDYLGLISLMAFVLCLIGFHYLSRVRLIQLRKAWAVLQVLGSTRPQIVARILAELLSQSIFALIIATAFASFLLPAIEQWIEPLFQFDLHLQVHVSSLLQGFVLAFVGSCLCLLPSLWQQINTKPALLFLGADTQQNKQQYSLYIPFVAFLWSLSVFLSHSLKMGSLFFVGMIIAAIILLALYRLLFQNIYKLTQNFTLKHALRNCSRHKASYSILFLSIGLSSLLITLPEQLKLSIQNEMDPEHAPQLPSFFFFDIQDDQAPAFVSWMKSQGRPLPNLTAMIRARLTHVNNTVFEKADLNTNFKTREQEQNERSRNRMYNLTYRDSLLESEKLYSGKPFAKNSPLNQISLEYRFADRLGLKIGDTLTFDILGVPFEGKVVNLRRVRWTSFDPNFFIVFNSGVLNDVPKTFLASLRTPLTPDQKVKFQAELNQKFNNISTIDVGDISKKLMQLVSVMGQALSIMALLSFAVGLGVLFSIAFYQANLRKSEPALLKIFGLNLTHTWLTRFLEWIFLGSAAVIFGSGLSMILATLIALFGFDSTPVFAIQKILMIDSVILLVCLLLVSLTQFRFIKLKPQILLRED